MRCFRDVALLLAWVVGLAACREERSAAPARFEVTRILPQRGAQDEAVLDPIYLNQEITVRFSGRVDPLSVTADTVRMTDAQGRLVKGRLQVHSHWVTFAPVAPLDPDLEDGSFRPGQEYRLEVVGFPRAGAVRSATGEVLAVGVVRRFRALPADHQPSPLLHSSEGPGFCLEEEMLAIAKDSQRLNLFFYEPPMPTTVTPAAFELMHAHAVEKEEKFHPRSVKLYHLARSTPELPGWMVELEVGHIVGPALGVRLSGDPGVALRNYRGELPRRVVWDRDQQPRLEPLVDEWLIVEVHPGERVSLIRRSFSGAGSDRTRFEPLREGAVNFEERGGRAVPQVRIAAGTGELGVFAPKTQTEIAPRRRFDRGDGVEVLAKRPVFDFLDVFVPRGVRVVVSPRSDELVQIRAAGRIRIDGELVLRGTPWGGVPGGDELGASEIRQAAGALLVAGGDIEIRGRIVHEPRVGLEPEPTASPLTLLAGGDIRLFGATLPARTYLGAEGDWYGETLGGLGVVLLAPMARQLEPGIELAAAAATEWYSIPRNRFGRIDVEVSELGGGLSLQVQIAYPDPSHPSRPSLETVLAPVSLPLREPLEVPPNGFVRFLFEGRVKAGEPLPSLGSLTVVGV